MAKPRTRTSQSHPAGTNGAAKPAPVNRVTLPPGIEASLAAFEAALPELLKEHDGMWAVITPKGVLRVGTYDDTQDSLYRWCPEDMKLDETEFLVRFVAADAFEVCRPPKDD